MLMTEAEFKSLKKGREVWCVNPFLAKRDETKEQ